MAISTKGPVNAVTVLIVPGLGGSGPVHWQTQWEIADGYTRVEQQNWDAPIRGEWIKTLDSYVRAAVAPVVLVAHSLACALIANWAKANPARSSSIGGALLVAPADVDSEKHTPMEARVFSPMPLARLPFRSIVVMSSNDPYVEPDRARMFADRWGAEVLVVNKAGHFNTESGLGDWPDGRAQLNRIMEWCRP